MDSFSQQNQIDSIEIEIDDHVFVSLLKQKKKSIFQNGIKTNP